MVFMSRSSGALAILPGGIAVVEGSAESDGFRDCLVCVIDGGNHCSQDAESYDHDDDYFQYDDK